jgi:hypothetical protein
MGNGAVITVGVGAVAGRGAVFYKNAKYDPLDPNHLGYYVSGENYFRLKDRDALELVMRGVPFLYGDQRFVEIAFMIGDEQVLKSVFVSVDFDDYDDDMCIYETDSKRRVIEQIFPPRCARRVSV